MAYGSRDSGRIPNSEHESHPWRIREIVPDFTLEDVWALPVDGEAGDFPKLVEMLGSLDPAQSDSSATRFLWQLRARPAARFNLGRITVPAGSDGAASKLPIPGTNETSLLERLPEDLRGTAADADFGSVPFSPLYRPDPQGPAATSNH